MRVTVPAVLTGAAVDTSGIINFARVADDAVLRPLSGLDILYGLTQFARKDRKLLRPLLHHAGLALVLRLKDRGRGTLEAHRHETADDDIGLVDGVLKAAGALVEDVRRVTQLGEPCLNTSLASSHIINSTPLHQQH
jgi:hypothetical protein